MMCVICESGSGTEHTFREMMFGTRDEFAYWECSACGCIQIIEVPENLPAYYPDDYYSFSLHASALQLWLYRMYCKAPSLAKLIRPAGVTFQSVLNAKLKPGARILDVGCGGGKLVNSLRSVGFDAHGIDPFVATESAYVRRVRLEDDVTKDWDLVMFQHSLEHMTGHTQVLRSARAKLAAGATCLVRIPLANWAWHHYGKDWIQLDPPRHLFIHTLDSFSLTCQAAGLGIAQITFDSGPFQFYGSELYQRNISLNDGFSKKEKLGKPAMRKLAARAAELNRQKLGDQASFYLKSID